MSTERPGLASLTRPQNETRPRSFVLIAKIAVPVALIGLLLWQFDWSRAAVMLSTVPFWVLLPLFGVMVLELVVSTFKWSFALRMHNLHFSFGHLWRALCSGFFLNSFLPSAVGGDVYRVYKTLPEEGFQSRALSAVLIERAVGLLALLAFGALGALIVRSAYQTAQVYCLAMIGVTAVGACAIVALERGWLTGFTERWGSLAPLAAVHHSLGLMRNRRREWLQLLLGSALYQAMSIGILYGLFAMFTSDASLAKVALIAALVGVAAVLPISINGIGVMEGALVGGAVMLGIDYDVALLVALLRRMLNLALAAFCGVLHAAAVGRQVGRLRFGRKAADLAAGH